MFSKYNKYCEEKIMLERIMLERIKSHFVDRYGLTGYSIAYLILTVPALLIALLFFAGNAYNRYVCDSYQNVTGFETRYVNFDSCYIKGSDNVFIRYDNKYKSIK
ncbi:hypothetical protein VaK_0049 [Vibrio phage VaK]|nr:hypothetical protein VaK_0049 [Vibrio phage VaK]